MGLREGAGWREVRDTASGAEARGPDDLWASPTPGPWVSPPPGSGARLSPAQVSSDAQRRGRTRSEAPGGGRRRAGGVGLQFPFPRLSAPARPLSRPRAAPPRPSGSDPRASARPCLPATVSPAPPDRPLAPVRRCAPVPTCRQSRLALPPRAPDLDARYPLAPARTHSDLGAPGPRRRNRETNPSPTACALPVPDPAPLGAAASADMRP